MAVRINRVYTRVGDDGTTALSDGSRVPKTNPRIGAYADVDETNSVLGVALALGGLAEEIQAVLRSVQNDLFDVGADLATPMRDKPAHQELRITENYITRLEKWCDQFGAPLSKLESFVLPGGSPGAALLHQARTVCRRAERSGWLLREAEPSRTNVLALRYLNRLSDLLFILARAANLDGDVLWSPGSNA